MRRLGNRKRTWLLILLSLLFLGSGAAILHLIQKPLTSTPKLIDKSPEISVWERPSDPASESVESQIEAEKEPTEFATTPAPIINEQAVDHETKTVEVIVGNESINKLPEAPVEKHSQKTIKLPGSKATSKIIEPVLEARPAENSAAPDNNNQFEELDDHDNPAEFVEADDLNEADEYDEVDEAVSLVISAPSSGTQVKQPSQPATPTVVKKGIAVPDMIVEEEVIPEDGIQEGYVGIRINKTRGSAFYKVMINEEEQPYVDVQDALQTWLDLKPDCRMDRKYCQTKMPGTNTVFWLDAESLQMGNSDGLNISIPADAVIERNNKLWLRYDWWNKWLPMTTNWSVNSYILGFYPNFPLMAELKLQRIKSRKAFIAQKDKRDIIEKIPPIVPEATSTMQARYRLQYNRSSSGQTDVLGDFDVLADVLGGTFLTGGHQNVAISSTNVVTDTHGTMDYWRYTFKKKAHFNLLEFGDTWHRSTLLVPSVFVSNGVQFNRLESKHSAGLFEISDRTQPGTEIDVFLNGFILKTIIVGQDGLYSIEEQYVSGGDIVTLRFYYPDGSQREELIRIAPDNALILPPGVWDTRIVAGDTATGQFSHAGLRLGTGYASSIGVHAYDFPLTNGDVDKAVSLDAAWRPFNSLGLAWENLSFDHGDDYTFRLDYTGIPYNSFQYEQSSVHTGSPLYDMSSTLIQSTDLWKVRHLFRYAGWAWRGEYIDTVERNIFNTSLNKRFNQKYSGYFETQNEWNNDQRLLEFKKVGVTYAPDKTTMIDFSRAWTPQTTTWTTNYRIQKGGESNTWDLNLNASYTEGSSAASVGALWRLSRNLSTGFSASKDEFIVRVVWTDIITQKPGPKYWDEFATGTLAGTLMMPASDDNPAQPFKGAIIRADNKWIKTDTKGEYVITGLPTDQRVAVSVDNTSLDATVVPEEEMAVAYFRPGTRIHYDPKITWTTGIDGYVIHSKPIPEAAAVKIVRREDDKLIKTVSVESDGFFLAEGLSSGEYYLYLTDVENPPPPLKVDIPSGTDWISNIKWHWP